jgi:hypothetical protein
MEEKTKTDININGNVDESAIIGDGNQVSISSNVGAMEYKHWLPEINKVFHTDFLQLIKTIIKSEEAIILLSDWSYIFCGPPAYLGYLIVTTQRFIFISYKKQVSDEQIIESGIFTSKFISPSFEPLSQQELESRHITEFSLSYITSIQQVECLVDDDRLYYPKKVFRIMLGTLEENDLLFGTRFFLYKHDKAEQFRKAICHYNPKIKYFHK